MAEARLSPQDAAKLSGIIEDKFADISREKKVQILNSILKTIKPRHRRSLIDKIIEYSNLGAFSEETYRNAICEKLNIPVLTPEISAVICDLCDQIQVAEYKVLLSDDGEYEIRWTNTYKYQLLNRQGDEIGRYNTLEEAQEHVPEAGWSGYARMVGREHKDELIMELNFIIASQVNPTFLKKASTIQTIGMIFNAATIGKNILGNEAGWWAERAALSLAVPIDWTRSKLTGQDRQITFAPSRWQNHDWVNGLIFGIKMAKRGWTPKGVQGQYEIGYAPTFNKSTSWIGQVFKYMEIGMRVSLLGPDQASFTRAYETFLATQAKLMCINNKVPVTKENLDRYAQQIDDNMTLQAKEYGRRLTYQSDTWLSKGMARLKYEMNFHKEFGVGDVVIKFTKVASNLVMLGVDFSPFGLIKGVAMLNRAGVLEEGSSIREAEMEIGRALVGTIGFTGFGLWMGMVGILTGGPPDNDKERVFQKSLGNTSYKFNISALRRYVRSGFDTDKARWKDGDTLINYDWLQPIAMPVAMGVTASEEIKKARSGVAPFSGTRLAYNAVKAGVDTITNQPIFTGVVDLFRTGPGEELTPSKVIYNFLTAAIADGPASFVPATFRQGRLMSDPYLRQTYSDNPFQEGVNMMKNRLPNVSASLPAQTDYMGQPIKRSPGNDRSFINSFVSPYNKVKYTIDSKAEQVIFDLFEESKNPDALPGRMSKSITHKGETIKLTEEQYRDMLRMRGDYIEGRIERSAKLKNLKLPVAKRVEEMEKIYERAGEEARRDMKKELKLR